MKFLLGKRRPKDDKSIVGSSSGASPTSPAAGNSASPELVDGTSSSVGSNSSSSSSSSSSSATTAANSTHHHSALSDSSLHHSRALSPPSLSSSASVSSTASIGINSSSHSSGLTGGGGSRVIGNNNNNSNNSGNIHNNQSSSSSLSSPLSAISNISSPTLAGGSVVGMLSSSSPPSSHNDLKVVGGSLAGSSLYSSSSSSSSLSPSVTPNNKSSLRGSSNIDFSAVGSNNNNKINNNNNNNINNNTATDTTAAGKQQMTALADLPPLRETAPNDRVELFRKKLRWCAVVYDFNNPTANIAEKEIKRQTLLEIVEYVNNTRNCFAESIMPDLLNMVTSNIFRSLPPPSSPSPSTAVGYDPEDDEPTLESSWPHLQIVYEFFLRFVVSNEVDPKVAKRYIDQQFVLKLLEVFSSEDPRERDYLKTILHRVYGKIMALRSFIRKAIQHVFYKFVHENEVHKGISELLEILGSIINGFALPLKDEHKAFLEKSLIPLHKAKSLNAFHQQLTYCMTQYVEKDSRLTELIIRGLLRYWPITNTSKEVIFINELEEILELTQPPEFQRVMEVLFKKMALCIQSPHFQVAERVLFLWNNDYIVNMINSNKQQLFPIVIAALYKNSKDHWNSTVHGLTYNVSKLLAEADPKLFDECSDQNMTLEERKQQQDSAKELRWLELQTEYEKKIVAK